MPNSRPEQEGKKEKESPPPTGFLAEFFRNKTEIQRKKVLWATIAALMTVIIIIWSFFFRHDLSLIAQNQRNQEEVKKRNQAWQEIQGKFSQALGDWQDSFNKSTQEKNGYGEE